MEGRLSVPPVHPSVLHSSSTAGADGNTRWNDLNFGKFRNLYSPPIDITIATSGGMRWVWNVSYMER
jgi:hypothetical protein